MVDSRFHEHAPRLTATEARSGFRGRHVLWVLILSVTLATIALALAWGYRSRDMAAVDAKSMNRAVAASPVASQPARKAPSSQYLP